MVDLVDLLGNKNVQVNKMVAEVQAMNEVIQTNIVESNAQYKVVVDKHRRVKLFKEGDKMMVFFFRKKRFLGDSYSNLQQKNHGPYKILTKINYHAYVVDFSNTMSISKTFNIRILMIFTPGMRLIENKNSRTRFS